MVEARGGGVRSAHPGWCDVGRCTAGRAGGSHRSTAWQVRDGSAQVCVWVQQHAGDVARVAWAGGPCPALTADGAEQLAAALREAAELLRRAA